MRFNRRLKKLTKLCFYLILNCLMICNLYPVISLPNKYDLQLTIIDQSLNKRPIPGATVMIFGTLPDWCDGNSISLLTSPGGYVEILSVPEGMKNITITWKSRYNPDEVVILKSIINLNKTLVLKINTTVYDAELQFVTPKKIPIVGAEVRLNGVLLGLTNAEGKVSATQVPSLYTQMSQPYPVKVSWLGVDISPHDVIIEATKTYMLTVKNVGPLVVQVLSAQGQGLNAAEVTITKAGMLVFSGISDEQGMVSIEVPFGTYYINTNYKGFTNSATAMVNSSIGTVQILPTNFYIEIFGIAMSYTTYIWSQILIISAIVAIIIITCLYILFKKR